MSTYGYQWSPQYGTTNQTWGISRAEVIADIAAKVDSLLEKLVPNATSVSIQRQASYDDYYARTTYEGYNQFAPSYVGHAECGWNYNQQQYNHFPDAYSQGWQGHQNLTWEDDFIKIPYGSSYLPPPQSNFQSQPLVPPQQPPKVSLEDAFAQFMAITEDHLQKRETVIQSQPLVQPQQPPKPSLEDVLGQFMARTGENLQEQELALQNQAASIRNLEAQMGQIIDFLSVRPQEALPCDIETKPVDEVIEIPEHEYEPMSTLVLKSMVDNEDVIPYEESLEDFEMSVVTTEYKASLQDELHLVYDDSTNLALGQQKMSDGLFEQFLGVVEGVREDVDLVIPHVDFIIPDMTKESDISSTLGKLFLTTRDIYMHLRRLCDAVLQFHSAFLTESPPLLEHTKAWHEKYLFLDPG